MNTKVLKDELKKTAIMAGAADLGFGDLSELKAIMRSDLLQKYPTAISVVVPLSQGIMEEVITEPTITYFAHYRAVNRLIDSITLGLSLKLEAAGYKSYAVPASQSVPDDDFAGVFPHKTAGTLAGLGTIGKHGLFIHSHYGPAVRLGTVLTELPTEKKQIKDSVCGNCTICRDICPAMAIEGVNWKPGIERSALIDVRACSTHMKNAYQHIGRGVVCGLCITCCPYSHIKEFQGVENEI